MFLAFFHPGIASADQSTSLYAEEEKIHDVTTKITIRPDGAIVVVEQITYDFGTSYRHGIFRTIPLVKTNTLGKRLQLTVRDVGVVDQSDSPYVFHQTLENGQLTIKIGDPNRTISGMHVYRIKYTAFGALTYFSDHDELYWNVTGNEWNVPIIKANSEVLLPEKVDASRVRVSCFTGQVGNAAQDCNSVQSSTGGLFATTSSLDIHEGLTIVLGFPKNIVAIMEPEEVIDFWTTPWGKIVVAFLIIFVAIASLFWYIFYPLFLMYRWYRFGRDPKPAMGVTHAWFDAPKTKDLRRLTPGETGALWDETVDLSDLYATIVDLARRGYLRIIENKAHEFSFEQLKDTTNDAELFVFERVLLDGIFEDDTTVDVKDTDLSTTVEKVKTSLYEQLVLDGFFPKNPQKTRDMYTLLSVVALFTLNIPLFFVALLFGRAMPRKTMYGAEEAAVAKSLKNFLSSQDKQLAFQAKNQLFFEKLLPYAMAFGVEKIWAQRFADIKMTKPDWYEGQGSVFNSYYLANSLHSSLSGFASAATPTQSSSGFSSGFSGGSSGGGGGGGGGGSW